MTRLHWAAASLLVTSCVCGTDLSGQRFACTTDSDCVAGYACISGTCQSGSPTDAGTDAGRPDGGIDAGLSDAGVDSGVPSDAGSDAGPDCCLDPQACTAPTLLVAGQNGPNDFAVDPQWLYWVNLDDTVWRAQRDGGGATLLTAPPLDAGVNSVGARLILSSGELFWTTLQPGALSCGLFEVSATGGSATTVVFPEDYIVDMAAPSGTLYWIGDNTLFALPLDGGAVATLAGGSSFYYATAMAADPANVYWSEQVQPDGTLGRIGRDALMTGAQSTLAANQDVAGMTIDSTYVYWFNNTDAGVYELYRVRHDATGGVERLAATGLGGNAQGIAVDSSALYWTAQGSGPAWIFELPLDGGQLSCLQSGLAGAGRLAQDATTLYWGDGVSSIYSLTKH